MPSHDPARLTAAIQLATGQLEAASLLPDHQRWSEVLHVLSAARDEITKLQQAIPIDHDCMAGHQVIGVAPTISDEQWNSLPVKRGPGRPRKVTPDQAA